MTETVYATSFLELFWGLSLLLLTIASHALAMHVTLVAFRKEDTSDELKKKSYTGFLPLLVVGFLIGLAHLWEIGLWATLFYRFHCFPNFSTSFYVAMCDYTTLGCNIPFPRNWQLLGPMTSVAGMLMFAWSAAILITAAQKVSDA